MCTCLIAGRRASRSGYALLTANDDWDDTPALLTHVPRQKHAPDAVYTLVGGHTIPEIGETCDVVLTMVPNSTLMIGDIIASGETLVQCLRYVTDYYRRQGAQLRNIVLFTIGGTQGIEILEKLTREIRTYWPDFEGFITVYYEGVFSCYEEGDKGVSGINRALIDFYWKGGIIAPAFRRETLSMQNPLFEKCTIYDGGARRYEIHEHIDEVLEFWNGILERADQIDKQALLEEKLGHALPISYEDWVRDCHYGKLDEKLTRWLYQQERGFVESLRGISLEQIALQRIEEFTSTLKKYIL